MAAGLRVTGGFLSGRRLRVPKGDVRPTADRVRESLFARLTELEGTAVLDLFAGSGALGIEAISRGAERAVFVERAAPCVDVLRRNLGSLGLESTARVERGEAARVVRRLGRAGERFDVVFVDPPYAGGEVDRLLPVLVASGVLADDATVVVEHAARHPVPSVEGLVPVDERRYGETLVTRLRFGAGGGGPSAAANETGGVQTA